MPHLLASTGADGALRLWDSCGLASSSQPQVSPRMGCRTARSACCMHMGQCAARLQGPYRITGPESHALAQALARHDACMLGQCSGCVPPCPYSAPVCVHCGATWTFPACILRFAVHETSPATCCRLALSRGWSRLVSSCAGISVQPYGARCCPTLHFCGLPDALQHPGNL